MSLARTNFIRNAVQYANHITGYQFHYSEYRHSESYSSIVLDARTPVDCALMLVSLRNKLHCRAVVSASVGATVWAFEFAKDKCVYVVADTFDKKAKFQLILRQRNDASQFIPIRLASEEHLAALATREGLDANSKDAYFQLRKKYTHVDVSNPEWIVGYSK